MTIKYLFIVIILYTIQQTSLNPSFNVVDGLKPKSFVRSTISAYVIGTSSLLHGQHILLCLLANIFFQYFDKFYQLHRIIVAYVV